MSAPLPWMPVYLARLRDPRLALVAKALKKRLPEVVGYVLTAAGAAVEHCRAGIFTGSGGCSAADAFDAAAGWVGRSSLATELEAHGLLVSVGPGLQLAGWDDEAGAHLARAERERARKTGGGSAEVPRKVPGGSAQVPRLDVEGDREEETEKTSTTAHEPPLSPVTHDDGAPTPAPLRAGSAEEAGDQPGGSAEVPRSERMADQAPEALLAAWTKAAAPLGRPTLDGPLTPRLATLARARLREAPLATWERVFELVCAYQPLWEPSGRGWVASLGWVLKPGPALDSAKAGTYGPWERPVTPPSRPRCACCDASSDGRVFEVELCTEHAAQAVTSPDGPRAWVEARRRGAA